VDGALLIAPFLPSCCVGSAAWPATTTDDDEPLDDEPEVPARVRDAAEQLLAHARSDKRRSTSLRTDEQRLIGVLQLLGQLNDHRLAAAGLFISEDPEPRDDAERRDLADSERRFVIYCANQLAVIASAALTFAIELTASFDDHSTPSQARDQAVDELRVELLSELAIHTLRPVIDPLRPRKRDIAEHLGLIVLPSAALDVADAAHELTQHPLPGQAAITTTYLAAQLISAGDEIAAAADYHHWPALDDE